MTALYALRVNPLSCYTGYILDQQTKNAERKLPTDLMHALHDRIDEDQVLDIILHATKNKQALYPKLTDKLIETFDPRENAKKDQNKTLLEIFSSVSNNRQPLSALLLIKLGEAIDCEDLACQALAIFVQLAHRGEKLTEIVIHRILDAVISKKEYLSALPPIIRANQVTAEFKAKLTQILLAEISSENINIQKPAIETCRTMQRKGMPLDVELLSKLIQVGNGEKCDSSVRESICSLCSEVADKSVMTEEMQDMVDLANLKFSSNEDPACLFEILKSRVNRGAALFPGNYTQLADILDKVDSDLDLKLKALDILLLDKRQDQEMSAALSKSIRLLLKSSNSEQIKENCSSLIGVPYSKSDVKEITVNGKLGSCELYKCLEEQLKLSANPDVEFVESLLLPGNDDSSSGSSKLKTKALSCYSRIIKENKAQKLDQVVTHQAGLLFEKIVDFVPTDDEMKTLHLLVECICNEILFNNRTPLEVSMKLIVIMLLIESHGNKRTHSMVFRALRQSKYQAELFKDCCILKLKGLSRSGGIEELSVQKEEDLDVLEVAVSLSYIDFKVFTVDRKLWKRELFASNLFHEFKASQTEQMNFYRNWRQIEDKFGRERSTTLLALIQQRILSFESLEQINGTFLFFIYEISRIEIAVNILENELLPLKSPTKMWCRELVKNG